MTQASIARVVPRLDARTARGRIGLIALATDLTSEGDLARMRPGDAVALHVTRVPYANPTTAENLSRMQPRLSEAAALLLPGEPVDVVAFSCTSASVVIGEAAVAAAIRAAKPEAAVVTPVSAALAGFEALAVRRISLLAPYTPAVTASMQAFFAAAGLEVVSTACFGLEDDREMARISPDCIVEAAQATIADDAEALFISCTALRAAAVAERLEAAIGRPVVTSNQAMGWLALRRAGWEGAIDGYGRLPRLPAPRGAAP